MRGAFTLPRTPQELQRPAAADFMRVLAVFSVGAYHIWQQSWVGAGKFEWWQRSGAAWVDVMILLSAFCLFLPYANAKAQNKAITPLQPLAFYRRRAVRILPAYYVNITVSLFIAAAAKGWSWRLLRDYLAHITLTQTFFVHSYLATDLNGVTWTLSVLAVFYLLFPLLCKGMLRAPCVLTAALLFLQYGYTRYVIDYAPDDKYSFLFNQAPAFASTFAVGFAGALIFAYAGREKVLSSIPSRLCCTVLGAACLAQVFYLMYDLSHTKEYQLWQLQNRTALVFFACAALVLLALGLPFPLKRLWSLLAGFSYSFYLWHQMLAVFLKYTLRLPAWTGDTPPNMLGNRAWMQTFDRYCWAVALAAAILSTMLIERPAAAFFSRKNTAER